MSITTGVGLISGLDYESIISKLTAASSKPITLLQNQQSVLKTKNDAYSTLSSKLTALRDQLTQMLSRDDLTFKSASSSNSDVLAVSAGKDAAAGNYSVKVLQVAQSARIASQGFASLTAPISSTTGSFSIQVGVGSTQAYNISPTTTLGDLRDAINRDSSSGVTASIINDGTASNPYRLVLTSKKTGAANTIRINSNNTTLDFANKNIEAAVASPGNSFNGTVTSSGAYTGTGTLNLIAKVVTAGTVDGGAQFVVSQDGGLTFDSTVYNATSTAQDISSGKGVNIAFGAGTTAFAAGDQFGIDAFDPQLSKAADAMVSVDGITVTRDTNTFTDVIPGVTLTAKSASSTAVTAAVTNEYGMLTAAISSFQTNYNDLVTTLKSLSSYDATAKQAQPLFADSATNSIRQALSSIITTPISGISSKYNTIASLGMKLQADGTLKFDNATLNTAMSDDLDSVMRIFGEIGDSTSSFVQFTSSSAKTASGKYAINITQAATQASTASAQALDVAGLASNETLSFAIGSQTFNADLAAGDRIDTVVSKLNSIFSAQGATLEAVNDNGKLRVRTTAYGSAATFNISSDQAGNVASQLGIGTTMQTLNGLNVAGTINGVAVTGTGQTLNGAVNTASEGLALKITASSPTTATVNFTKGVADQMTEKIAAYIDGDKSMLVSRQKGIATSLSSMDTRITTLQTRLNNEATRMRAQFIAMEEQLAKYQGVGDYVTKQLAQLSASTTSSK